MGTTLLGIFLLLTVTQAPPVPEHTVTMNRMSAVLYLSKYGYMDVAARILNMSANNYTEKIMETALKKFQTFMDLPITGTLDSETIAAMLRPRCGRRDIVGSSYGPRVKRYTHQGSRRTKRAISYTISRPTLKLPNNVVWSEIKRAFDMWGQYVDFKFLPFKGRKAYKLVDINIRFDKGEHGDDDPFDGEGGTLAHATYPSRNDFTHFDDDEDWTFGTIRGRNLYQVALHEFGHSLGLDHSSVRNSVMYPSVGISEPDAQLQQDDIDGIQALYGKRFGRNMEGDNMTEPVTTKDQHLCGNPIVDTMFNSMEGTLLAFKGDKYYDIAPDGGVIQGSPKSISETWPGLPSNIDAAFTYRNSSTYFFKDSNVWRYTDSRKDEGFPKLISDVFSGLPNSIDAVMEWSPNGHVYFFKGEKIWDVNLQKSSQGERFQWKDVPGNLTAAFYYDDHTHFIQGANYYLYDDGARTIAREDPPYPHAVGVTWFGCLESDSLKNSESLSTAVHGRDFSITMVLGFSCFMIFKCIM